VVCTLGVRLRKISNAKVSHRMGDQNLLTRAPACFGKHVKPLVLAFAVVSTNSIPKQTSDRHTYTHTRTNTNTHTQQSKQVVTQFFCHHQLCSCWHSWASPELITTTRSRNQLPAPRTPCVPTSIFQCVPLMESLIAMRASKYFSCIHTYHSRLFPEGLAQTSWIFFQDAHIHTYIPLTLYPRRGSRGISDIPPRHPRFTKIS
jgi:hypothetical protein